MLQLLANLELSRLKKICASLNRDALILYHFKRKEPEYYMNEYCETSLLLREKRSFLLIGYRLLIILAISAIQIGTAFALEEYIFLKETDKAKKELKCATEKTTSEEGLGKLYSCISGSAQTVKWFVNEKKGTGEIENIKLMWNDWTSDIGHGLHADKSQAKEFLNSFIKLYAPSIKSELTKAFFGTENKKFDLPDVIIEYKYSKGPKIDEHLLVLKPIKEILIQNEEKNIFSNDFERCRKVVAKLAGYSVDNLAGDGSPVKETNHISFFIKGKGKDKFFCEVHPNNQYKVRAALNGLYPFKAIGQGSFE